MARRPTSGVRPARVPGRFVLVALGVAAVAVAALAAGCGTGTGSEAAGAAGGPGRSGAPRVAVVGDSITEQGEGALEAGLGDRWDLAVDGRSGFTIAQQLPAARSLGDDDPVQVVINLGTNDVLQGAPAEQAADDLRAVVAAFPGARCLHLVTINEAMDRDRVGFGDVAAAMEERAGGPVPSVAELARALNATMAALAAVDPRVDLVPWSAAVADADADADPASAGPVVYDTIHPTARGQELLVGLYGEALDGCPVGPVASS